MLDLPAWVLLTVGAAIIGALAVLLVTNVFGGEAQTMRRLERLY